jgi:hypothetical protein
MSAKELDPLYPFLPVLLVRVEAVRYTPLRLRVPALSILGTRLKFVKGVRMKDSYETTMGK